jgi:CheY-like chemotaxis protein
MLGSTTAQGRPGARANAPSRVAFHSTHSVGVPTVLFLRLNTQPMRTPVNASPIPSRASAHDSGTVWFARPSLAETCTLYSLPVSRRTHCQLNPMLALQILERGRPLDLLLVDYAMPEMNGRDVIDRARRYQPSLKMLLMTGYAEALHNDGMSGIPVLPKPFKAGELSRRIAELDELSSNNTVQGRGTLY